MFTLEQVAKYKLSYLNDILRTKALHDGTLLTEEVYFDYVRHISENFRDYIVKNGKYFEWEQLKLPTDIIILDKCIRNYVSGKVHHMDEYIIDDVRDRNYL